MGTVKVAVFICGLDFETFFLGVLDFFQNGWKMEKPFEKVLKRFILKMIYRVENDYFSFL